MNQETPNNVVYIDEFRREKWLLKLEVARRSGEIAVFNAINDTDATVLPFRRSDDEPDGAA